MICLAQERAHAVNADLAQALVHFLHHAVDLILDDDRRVVNLAGLDERVQHLVDVLALRAVAFAFFNALADGSLEILKRLVIRPYELGEFIVQRGFLVGLHALDAHLEIGFLAGIDALAVGRPAKDKLLLLACRHAEQLAVKAGRLHGILLVEGDVPVTLIEHDRLFGAVDARNDALHIYREEIAIGRGAIHILPAGVLFEILLQPAIHLGFVGFRPVRFDAQGTIVCQLDLGFQRHDELVGQRLELNILQARLRVRLDHLLLDGFAEEHLAEVVDELAVKVRQPKLLDDDVIGRLAPAEARDLVLVGYLGRSLA